MKNNPCFECVASCLANGKLTMERHFAYSFIEAYHNYIIGIGGEKRYHELLTLGALCEELQCDREAMNAYMKVFDYVMWDSRLKSSNHRRRHLKMLAAEGLLRLTWSPEEVVWEICSQATAELYCHR